MGLRDEIAVALDRAYLTISGERRQAGLHDFDQAAADAALAVVARAVEVLRGRLADEPDPRIRGSMDGVFVAVLALFHEEACARCRGRGFTMEETGVVGPEGQKELAPEPCRCLAGERELARWREEPGDA